MVTNLLANAIKFTGAGGRVGVAVGRSRNGVALSVSDTGIGIGEDDQARLFERFFRARNAADNSIPGTGLGLAISKGIVDAHGGTLTVESALDEGTAITVLLPTDPVPRTPTTPRRRSPMSEFETPTARVLVADDEPHLLRLVKFRLEREGYEVLTATDGEAALKVAREERPDLCVLDVMMPKRSGFDVLRELRSDDGFAGMKVIMLTARAQDRDVDVGFSLGADDYITKPFSPQELRVRIGAHWASGDRSRRGARAAPGAGDRPHGARPGRPPDRDVDGGAAACCAARPLQRGGARAGRATATCRRAARRPRVRRARGGGRADDQVHGCRPRRRPRADGVVRR